jgi:hypothetical protein
MEEISEEKMEGEVEKAHSLAEIAEKMIIIHGRFHLQNLIEF